MVRKFCRKTKFYNHRGIPIMPNQPVVALSSQPVTAGQSSAVSHSPSLAVIQSLLQLYGFPQQGAHIQAVERQAEMVRQQLQSAIQYFVDKPSVDSRDNLVAILEQELVAVQKRYKDAIAKCSFHQHEADQAAIQAKSARGLSWIKHSVTDRVKDFFGSTPAQQVEKYQAIAARCLQHRAALADYIAHLKTVDFAAIESRQSEVTGEPERKQPAATTPVAMNMALDVEVPGSVPLSAATSFPAVISLAELDSKTGFTIDAESAGDNIGVTISAGDVDGDGFSDLVLGAPARDGGIGSAYVVRSSNNLGQGGVVKLTPSSQIMRMDGETSLGQITGAAVSVIGDVKNSGGSAILIGAPGYNGYTGRSYLVYGGSPFNQSGSVLPLSSLDGENGVMLNGENLEDFSGQSIGDAGDINGDGQPDMLVGAIGYGDSVGRGYVIKSDSLSSSAQLSLASLNGSNGYQLSISAGNAQLGWVATGIGDFNGDGYEDMAISAPYYNNSTGSVFIVYGGPGIGQSGEVALDNPDGVQSMRLDGESSGDFAGWSVSAIKPTGRPSELLIGAPHHGKAGRTYLLQGGHNYGSRFSLKDLDASLGSIMDGENAGDNAGYAVGSIGNMAGDGVPYFAIGAPGYNASQGRTYVVRYENNLGFHFNLSLLQGSNGFVVNGENPSDFSGSVVAAGGDLHRNNSANLVIGAPGYNKSSGRAYVIYGTRPGGGDSDKLVCGLVCGLIVAGAVISAVVVASCAFCVWRRHRKNSQQLKSFASRVGLNSSENSSVSEIDIEEGTRSNSYATSCCGLFNPYKIMKSKKTTTYGDVERDDSDDEDMRQRKT
jgi:hypothetical protein